MIKFVLWGAVAAIVFIAFVTQQTVAQHGRVIGMWVESFVTVIYYGLIGMCVTVPIAGAVTAYLLINKQRANQQRRLDGSHSVREYWGEPFVLRWIYRLRGIQPTRYIIDPDKSISGFISVSRVGVIEHTGAFDPTTTFHHALAHVHKQTIAAQHPGDNAYIEGDVRGGRGGAVKPTIDKNLLPEPQEDELTPVIKQAPEPEILNAVDAMGYADNRGWPIGQNIETNAVARFNPAAHAHAGIIGSTGTGKTTSAGFTMAAHAIRQGYHTIILDPDDGDDWSPFQPYAEWIDIDRDRFPVAVQAIYTEFSRRSRDDGSRPLFIIIEEYGDMIDQLRRLKKSTAEACDDMIDTVLRRGRKRGIHLCFVDQYPERWSQQVIGGTKWKAVFKLGPNQGAKLQEYQAGRPGVLADVGEFLLNDTVYKPWHAEPLLQNMLYTAPQLNGYRVIDGSGVRSGTEGGGLPAIAPPVEQDTNTVRTSGEQPFAAPFVDKDTWRTFVLDYMATEQGVGLWSTPAQGVTELARAMAEYATGNTDDYKSYKGLASDLAKEIRGSATVAGAGKFGVDITEEL